MRVQLAHVLLAVGAVVAWLLAHIAVRSTPGAFVTRQRPRLEPSLPDGRVDDRGDERPKHTLRSPEPDPEGMRTRYDAAIYAHLEGRALTPAQERIVQFHYHGEGCRVCAG